MIASVLRALGERGFPLDQPLLAVLDGAKGLRAAVEDAYAHGTYGEAKHALERLLRALRVVNESAAARLAEGLEETLPWHRLHVFVERGVRFRTTNLIASVMARLEAKTQRVTRWKTSDQQLRWCATARWTTQNGYRIVSHDAATVYANGDRIVVPMRSPYLQWAL